MPHEVIMPALGMAQKTGLIVAWLKKPGEAVKAGDALMEVETDKAVMEVEAQADGFLTDVRTAAGEAAPVGEVIALISESPAGSGAPATPGPAAAMRPQGDAPVPAVQTEPALVPAEGRAAKPAAEPERETTGRRILASPKVRRLAAEQGLDLSRLVAAGAPQPYHVSDLETLRALPGALAAPAPQTAQASRHLTARVRGEGFVAFLEWMRAETGASPDATSVMAGMAAAALRQGAPDGSLIVAAEAFGRKRLYADPDRLGLGRAKAAEPSQAPALILRDLRATGITALRMGVEAAPVLSVIRDGPDMLVTLECAPGHLKPEAAVDLISGFAGQLAEPLRHLL